MIFLICPKNFGDFREELKIITDKDQDKNIICLSNNSLCEKSQNGSFKQIYTLITKVPLNISLICDNLFENFVFSRAPDKTRFSPYPFDKSFFISIVYRNSWTTISHVTPPHHEADNRI